MNPLEQAIIEAATVGGGPEMVFDVPEDAKIQLAEGTGHLLDGATITHWTHD